MELRAFNIEYQNVKFTATNFSGRTKVKYFMHTQFRFCKDTVKVSFLPLLEITPKSTHFFPTKKNILILWIELKQIKIQKVLKPYILKPSGKKFAN